MEDEGNHGNDETRLFILSSLAQHHKSRISCVLCEDSMLVFDRYPLVDGTFFLSPKRHTSDCIEVKYEGQTQYLTALCMGCLEGVSPDRIIRCRLVSMIVWLIENVKPRLNSISENLKSLVFCVFLL